MERMNPEWLVELVDREPTHEERAQLAEHPEWEAELRELQAMTDGLGSLASMQPPRGDWQMLEARLTSEGLIQPRKNPLLSLPLSSSLTRAAAAAALFLGGAYAGATWSGPAGSDMGQSVALAVDADVGAAQQAVQEAEQQYLNSLLRYRTIRGGSDAFDRPDPARSQALDLLVQASQSALRQAPDDPFINLFLVNTLAERSAMQRASRSEDNWF